MASKKSFEKILLPSVPDADQSNDQKLETAQAHEIQEYLGRYAKAGRKPVTLSLMWRTSMRKGGLCALDKFSKQVASWHRT